MNTKKKNSIFKKKKYHCPVCPYIHMPKYWLYRARAKPPPHNEQIQKKNVDKKNKKCRPPQLKNINYYYPVSNLRSEIFFLRNLLCAPLKVSMWKKQNHIILQQQPPRSIPKWGGKGGVVTPLLAPRARTPAQPPIMWKLLLEKVLHY